MMLCSLFFLCAVLGIMKALFFIMKLVAVPVKSYNFRVYNYSHDIHIRLIAFVFYWF